MIILCALVPPVGTDATGRERSMEIKPNPPRLRRYADGVVACTCQKCQHEHSNAPTTQQQ